MKTIKWEEGGKKKREKTQTQGEIIQGWMKTKKPKKQKGEKHTHKVKTSKDE